jgi:hypothetical protein
LKTVKAEIMVFLSSWRILLPAASELKMEAAGSSEMLLPVYRIMWHNILEDHALNIHYEENLGCLAVQA